MTGLKVEEVNVHVQGVNTDGAKRGRNKARRNGKRSRRGIIRMSETI